MEAAQSKWQGQEVSLLETVSAPNLEVVRGDLIIGQFNKYGPSTSLTSLDFSKLTFVGGSFKLIGNDLLNLVLIPNFASIQGANFFVIGNPSLTSLNAPLLTGNLNVNIVNNNALKTVVFPAMTSALSLILFANPSLGTVCHST